MAGPDTAAPLAAPATGSHGDPPARFEGLSWRKVRRRDAHGLALAAVDDLAAFEVPHLQLRVGEAGHRQRRGMTLDVQHGASGTLGYVVTSRIGNPKRQLAAAGRGRLPWMHHSGIQGYRVVGGGEALYHALAQHQHAVAQARDCG